MLDALKTLFENDVVNEEVRREIEEAWESRVKENRQAATAELREEFAKKYEFDKSIMVESIDKLLEERLSSELAEFAEDRKQLAEAKAKYAVAMRENSKLLKGFVMESLKKEVSELHEDQKAMADKFSQLEEFVVESLAKEIAEFYEDKNDLAETKVRLVREAKQKFATVQKEFVTKSAALVSETIGKNLNKEIKQLKEDIEVARTNDFGRKLFEAFASEYANSYLNEKSETSKLLKVIATKEKQVTEAKTLAVKAKRIAESIAKERSMLVETARRDKILSSLVAPLGKSQREIMTDLLESVHTDRLQQSFSKYLPSVIDGNTPAKRKAQLIEGKEITGNRENTNVSSKAAAVDHNVIDIKRLAGL
jgi:hypothetical protein|tara:strand:- start:804 stop:1901 length:1098 start_codon:yes stop_codon:yes gene_type:complete